MTGSDWVAVLVAGLVMVIAGGVLVGYWLGRREAGPTVARLAGRIDELQDHNDHQRAALNRITALIPRTIRFRIDPIGVHPASLEINGVGIVPRRMLEARDDILRGRVAISVRIEAGDWPVAELLAGQGDPGEAPGPFAAADLTELRTLLAEQLAPAAGGPG